MSVIQIIDAFAFYGLDVILLAGATCVIVQVLKKTLLKKCNKKLFTFLPFLFGVLFYAIYACVRNLSFTYLINEYVSILEHGFSVGALSTLIYVWYEQFLREKTVGGTTENVIATLIEGYVPSDEIETVAKQIASAIEKDVTGNGAEKTANILLANGEEGISEKDVKLLAKLIIETLAHINATT
ncbi:MAG: hypothetical protein ACI4MS_03765 [Candidatus Coproplasma sp.]